MAQNGSSNARASRPYPRPSESPPPPRHRVRADPAAQYRAWEPKLKIDRQVQIALEAVVAPYFDKNHRKRLCGKVQAILADKFPEHIIAVLDFTHTIARISDRVQLGIVCDGVPDQGLIFHRAKPDGTIYGEPAND